jgi:type I restriction enzyme, S subunit
MKWKECEIGNLVELRQGLCINKKSNHLVADSGLPLLRITDMINQKHSVFIKEEVPEKFIAKYEDIIYSRTGQVGLVFRHQFGVLFNNCFTVTPIGDELTRDFLYWFLRCDDTKKTAEDYASGAAQLDLSHSAFKSIKIKYPDDKTIQRKIASILSAYDDLIENNLKRIKLLEEKAGLMLKLLQEELKDSTKINLYEFADVQMGFAFKAEAFNEEGEGIPIIRIRDIPKQITKSYTTQEVENQYWVEKGDLLIGMDGEFHMNEWLGQRGYLVQRVCRLRTKNPLFQSYLWQALKEPIHYYETTISGATVAHLGKKHLEEIFIAEPKESMKNELQKMNTMRNLKIVLAEQNTKLREARDILLPKLMSGQIEV